MTSLSPDHELLSAYAQEGSETAFRALVGRHVNLVYATALRQLGDSGSAEEITQNVFVALARKAPRLGGVETLAGWLHRTTILEAKARIRAELRRQRRSAAAAELAWIQGQGEPAADALAPLLDEGLLNLRDGDRLALVLRFLEERSLRDVGDALGVNEDAARKRVTRALDRLAEFFRRRGFAVGAGAVALLAGTTKAAPAGLAASAGDAGLAAGGAATGFKLFVFHLMSATKTQTAVACALLAAAPLALQWHAEARIARERTDVAAQLAAANRTTAGLEQEISRARAAALAARNDTADLQFRLAQLNAERSGRAPRPVYQWDDNSPVVRVPKQFLALLPVSAVANRRGQLSDQIREVLQLSDVEAEQVQGAVDRFLAAYSAAQGQELRQVEPTADDLQGHKPEETRVFELSALGESFGELRRKFFDELQPLLGAERFALFRKAIDNWMPVDDDYHGLNSSRVVFNGNRRERFYQPAPDSPWVSWSFSSRDPQGTMTLPIAPDDVPEYYRPYLQDWIALAKSKAGAGGVVTP